MQCKCAYIGKLLSKFQFGLNIYTTDSELLANTFLWSAYMMLD